VGRASGPEPPAFLDESGVERQDPRGGGAGSERPFGLAVAGQVGGGAATRIAGRDGDRRHGAVLASRPQPSALALLRERVVAGRLRTVLRMLAGVRATTRGFVLAPRRAHEVVVLAPPVEEQHAAVLALLADGGSWASSALALALGASQRAVQLALDSLAAAGKVQSFGSSALDDPARAGIHDDLVTPCATAGWLGCTHDGLPPETG